MILERDFLLKLAVNLDRVYNSKTIESLKEIANGKIKDEQRIKNILLDTQYALSFLEKNKLLNELINKLNFKNS